VRQRLEIGRDAWIDYVPGWIAPGEADALLQALTTEIAWEQLPIQVFGKPVMQPRLMAWAGALPYRYSGLTLEPRPLPPALAELCARASEASGEAFNHVVLNLYRDGRDHIGMHADNERELGRDPIIGSLSLGATRRFVLKPKNRKIRKKRELRLLHGCLIVMGGACQHSWYHGVPAEPSVAASRINVTFRRLLGPPGWRPPVEGDA
jgi:alkylated DNA repair dioxygenase AlkB